MGQRLSEILSHQRIGVDSNIFIYALEDNHDFPLAREFFEKVSEKHTLITSIISILEATVPLFKLSNQDAVTNYIEFVKAGGRTTLLKLDEDIALEAARLRAGFALSTPDAIQLASASAANASVFITADKKLTALKNMSGLEIMSIDD